MGNVIPGVAIATALMPPLCTVGFGIATTNWLFALGALYLYLINTIFISLATFLGVTLVMRYPKKEFVDKDREKRVKQIVTFISIVTIIPSVFITFQMVQETIFVNRCHDFCRDVVRTDKARLISSEYDYNKKTIRLVLLGEELDSVEIAQMVAAQQQYGLGEVHLDIVQGASGLDAESVQGMLSVEKNKLLATQRQLSDNEIRIKQLHDSIGNIQSEKELSRTLLPEVAVLFPQVVSMSTGTVLHAYMSDSVMSDSLAYFIAISTKDRIRVDEETRLKTWLQQRLDRMDIELVVLSLGK
jgi:hypothetical protein